MPEPIIIKKPKKRSKRSKQLRKLGLPIFTLIVISLIVLIAYNIFFPDEEDFILDFYTYATVNSRDFLDSLTASGMIKPRTIHELKAEVNASILEVLVEEGQDVIAGEPLIRLYSQDIFDNYTKISSDLQEAQLALDHIIDDHDYELTLGEMQVVSANDQVVIKEANLELQQTLYQFGVIARVELSKAEQELREANQSLAKAENDLKNTNRTHANALEKAKESVLELEEQLAKVDQQIADLEISSPIDGRVLALNIPQSSDLKSGETIVEVADLTTQFVELQTNPNQASKFNVGTTADITIGQTSYPATVSYIAPQAQQTQDGSIVTVRLDFEKNTIDLRPNSNVSVSIHLGIYYDSLSLPRGAYLTSGQQLFVYLIDGDQATQQDVQFGMLQGNNIQILGGLKKGDQVIVSSYDQYRNLSEINIIPEGGREID